MLRRNRQISVGSGGKRVKTISKIRGPGKSANRCAQNLGRGKSRKGRLSKELLHDLRNKIPVRGLIENELGVRCEMESGIFRFECPLCASFHTSVMKTQNLAKCFVCEINFNPIDMVMAVKNTEFRQSADFLTNLLESGMQAKSVAPATRSHSELVSLSRVFSSMAEPPSDGTAARRIQSLEKEVAKLGKRMDRLQQFLVQILSKRGAYHEKFGKIDARLPDVHGRKGFCGPDRRHA